MGISRIYYTGVILLLIVLGACDQKEITPEQKSLIDLLSRKWEYSELRVDNQAYYGLDSLLEVQTLNQSYRYQLWRKHFIYNSDGSYILAWDRRGEYNLGTRGHENWQPPYGFFRLDTNSNTIVHNSGLEEETTYNIIQLTENTLIRESQRVMANTYGTWTAGQTVTFTEVFVPYDR